MGKSSRILKANLDDEYNRMTKEVYGEDKDDDISLERSPEEIFNEKLYNTSLKIYNELLEYSKKTGVPMCEYLNLEEVENYVKWILTS